MNRLVFSLLFFVLASVPANTYADSSVRGGSATGSSATGGSATGGSARGGDALGGSAVGGSAVGGSATGGHAVGGSARGGDAAVGDAAIATPGTATAGTATANVGGRAISATADGGASIQAHGNGASIRLGSHMLRIEHDQVLLDGRERARLAPSARAVAITLSGGRLTVRADGTDVLSERLPRVRR